MDLETARTRLQERLAEIDRSATTLTAEDAGNDVDLSHVHQHPGDQGTELADFERENALIEAAQNDKGEIEAALERIDAGTFGRCIDCGKEIPEGRLEIKPEAARCLEDQAKFEAR
ncbi:MAG TPA: TraR/DksA C4-type zinc finger protein [Frankiaceae bacterium]|nr:TraR/DksA C4-type zinc finger protein [Frankiaceae bacterium]